PLGSVYTTRTGGMQGEAERVTFSTAVVKDDEAQARLQRELSDALTTREASDRASTSGEEAPVVSPENLIVFVESPPEGVTKRSTIMRRFIAAQCLSHRSPSSVNHESVPGPLWDLQTVRDVLCRPFVTSHRGRSGPREVIM